jgi:hypothetical protein
VKKGSRQLRFQGVRLFLGDAGRGIEIPVSSKCEVAQNPQNPEKELQLVVYQAKEGSGTESSPQEEAEEGSRIKILWKGT